MSVRPCPTCAQDIPENARFCPHCGTPSPEDKTCVGCGSPMPKGAKYCPSCGTAISKRKPIILGQKPQFSPPPPPIPDYIKEPLSAPLESATPETEEETTTPGLGEEEKPKPRKTKAGPKPARTKATPQTEDKIKLPPQRLRGAWFMLCAGTSGVFACIHHQTTILPWELPAGTALVLFTALLMFALHGKGRSFGALLTLLCAAWAVWQADTYRLILPDFLDDAWPLITLLPLCLATTLLAAIRSWKSLISPPWRMGSDGRPQRRTAILGVLWIWFVMAVIIGVGVLPHDIRRPLINVLYDRDPKAQPGQATPPQRQTREAPPSKAPTGTPVGANPLGSYSPAANSQAQTAQPSRGSSQASSRTKETASQGAQPFHQVSTQPKPGQTVVIPSAPIQTAEVEMPAGGFGISTGTDTSPVQKGEARKPRAYPRIAETVAALPLLAATNPDEVPNRSGFSPAGKAWILSTNARADGTDLVRVACPVRLRDASGHYAPGEIHMDLIMDEKGRVVASGPPLVLDADTLEMMR